MTDLTPPKSDGILAIFDIVKDFYDTGIDDHIFVFILLVLIIADLVLGVSRAIARKEYSSHKMRVGGLGHTSIFVLVAVAYPFADFLGAGVLADGVILWLCGSYALSMLKNLQLLGVEIPFVEEFIRNRIDNHKLTVVERENLEKEKINETFK